MKEHIFTCPNCGHNKLGSVEQVIMTYPITKIPDDGDLSYGKPVSGDGQVLAYQCMNCGYELKNKDGNVIQDCLKVVEWIKNNTTQKTEE